MKVRNCFLVLVGFHLFNFTYSIFMILCVWYFLLRCDILRSLTFLEALYTVLYSNCWLVFANFQIVLVFWYLAILRLLLLEFSITGVWLSIDMWTHFLILVIHDWEMINMWNSYVLSFGRWAFLFENNTVQYLNPIRASSGLLQKP